jgi:protein-tyrosine kinase
VRLTSFALASARQAGPNPVWRRRLGLKLLSKADIDFALSQQFNYAYLSDQGDTSLSSELVAAYKPFSRVGENLRAVRSQLMLRWFNTDPAHKVLALVSPGRGEGRSFVAANLAIVFAQQGQRTLLIDGDLRSQAHAQPANNV